MNITVRQKKPFVLKSEIANFYKYSKKVVAVGYPVELVDGVRYPGKAGKKSSGVESMRVTDVAYIQEYGSKTRKIPARPFMEKSLKPTENMVIAQNSKLAKMNRSQRNKRETQDRYLNIIGEKATSIHKKVITDLKEPPNSPVTIAIKGSNNPLIDTGLMRNTLTYVVRKRGKK